MSMHAARAPTEADREIGQRITAVRKGKSLSLLDLAGLVGVSHTQIGKYEAGQNRIGAARLADIARALEVSVSELVGDPIGRTLTRIASLPEDAIAVAFAFDRITSGRERARLARYIADMADNPDTET